MQKLKEFFYILQNSLINPQYYQKIKEASFWSALRYLYVLSVIISFAYSLSLALTLVPLIPQTPQIQESLKTRGRRAYPDGLVISVKDGQLSTNVAQPYYYRWETPSGEKALAVIDTNASVEDYQKYKDSADILITKTAIVYPKSSNQTEIFFLKEFSQPVTLDKESYLKGIAQLEPYLNYLQPLLATGIVVILVFGTLIGASFMLSEKLLNLLVFSLLVFLVIKIARQPMPYGQIYKIAMHASTLPILFFSLLGFFGLQPAIPFGYSLLLGLIMAIILHRLWTKTS